MERKSPKARSVKSPKKKNRAEKRSRHLNRNLTTNLSPPKALDETITESFAQLDLSDDGPISRLPNELVQSILVRLNMQELIPMLVVCKKWQAVIYLIGHKKKSLFLTDSRMGTFDGDSLKKRSFGQIDSNTFTSLSLNSSLRSSKPFYPQLGKLFTSVEQLVVHLPLADIITLLDLFSSSQLTTLSIVAPIYDLGVSSILTRINSYTSLKRLDIYAYCNLLQTLAPTFARLEHFSCHRLELANDFDDFAFEDDFIADRTDDVFSHVDHFGPNCSRIWLQNFDVINPAQWHSINGQWLANLTHLMLKCDYSINQIISILAKYSVALEVLYLDYSGIFLSFLNSHLVGHLSKLVHLTEIGLNCIAFDLDQLGGAARKFELIPLSTIRTFAMSIDCIAGDKNIDQFTSVLSTILPNVEHLNINSCIQFEGVEQYMTRFTKLQTHSFNVLND